MKFYFVRHGETRANREQVFAGSGLDHPLTETGHTQAEKLARKLKQIAPDVAKVYSSSLLRARQTASYLARSLGVIPEIAINLHEWALGEWEGKPYAEFWPELLNGGEPRGGEPRTVFYSRVQVAWQALAQTDPYILVSHGGVWMALQDTLNIPRFKLSNCQIAEVRNLDDQWRARIIELDNC